MFNEYRVSIKDDEKVWGMDNGDGAHEESDGVFTSFFVTSFSSVSKAALRRIASWSFYTASKERSRLSAGIMIPYRGQGKY